MTKEQKIEMNKKLGDAQKNPLMLFLTFKQTQKLKKGNPITLVVDYKGYRIMPCELPKELLGYSEEQLRTALKTKKKG